MQMQHEAAIITAFLAERKIKARITGGFPAPAFSVYSMEFAPSEKFSRLTGSLDELQTHIYARRVAAGILDVNDPAQRVVIRFSEQPPALEVSRQKPDRLNLSQMPLHRLNPFEGLAGVTFVTKTGQPVTWNLTDPGQPHALVAGMSGSGKSNLLLSLILSLCHNTDPANLSIFIADGGNSSLLLAERLVHVVDIAGDKDGVAAMVEHVASIVHARKRESAINPEHRVLLVVDELANLLSVMQKAEAAALQQNLAVIAAEGRKFGVHLVAGTQKPLSEVTGSLTKSNLAVRFVGAMAGWQDAQTATDIQGSGAERLAGRGDFIARIGMSVRRFQVPFVDISPSTMRTINRRWSEAANSFDDIHAAVRPGQAASATVAAPTIAIAAPPSPSIPAALVAIFRNYDQGDGTLRRGWKTAAVTAANDGKLPTGTVFQKLSEEVEIHLLTYFAQQKPSEMAPILRLAASK